MITDQALNTALRHWGVRAVPFSDNPGEAPFPSAPWEQALRLLEQTAALRSLMLLHGDNGVGKSALVGHWLSTLEPKVYLPLNITHATLSGSGLLAVLLLKLGQKPSLMRSRNLARFEEAIKDLGRLTPVLVLDEAQHYPPGAWEEIRLLLGLNLARQPVLALVLMGDLYLQETLRLGHHRALYSADRSPVRLGGSGTHSDRTLPAPQPQAGGVGATGFHSRGGGSPGGRQPRVTTPTQPSRPFGLDHSRSGQGQHHRTPTRAGRPPVGSFRRR